MSTTLRELAGAIVGNLNEMSLARERGHRWRVVEGDPTDWDVRESGREMRGRVRVQHETIEGAQITLSAGVYGHKGRLLVSGAYPVHNGTSYPSRRVQGDPQGKVTVADTKSPEDIAKDIERRFLPGYLQSLALAAEELAGDVAYEDSKATLTAELASVAGKAPYQNGSHGFSMYRDHGGYVRGQVNGPDSVDLEIRSLPAESARAILRLLLQMTPRETGS